MDLNKSVSELYLVGPAYAKKLAKLEISTIGDLLYHFPHRYLDYSLTSPMAQVQPGETVSVKGEVVTIKNLYTKYGKKIQQALIKDNSGTLEVVWFNQPFLAKILKPGLTVNLAGKIDWFGKKIVMVSPEYEIDRGVKEIHTARLVPIYHETAGVSSKWLRSRIAPLIKAGLTEIKDFLPSEIITNYNLMDISQALTQIHFPKNLINAEGARKRFAFEELFLIQLAALVRKKNWERKKAAYSLIIDQEKLLEFMARLPFELTSAQKRAIKEILADLGKNKPMNRLLEGDVGSGKTIVAAAAIYQAFLNGLQTAFMAPTEILASQHYHTLTQILNPLGIKVGLLTSAHKIIKPKSDLLIGTHALIYQKAKFQKLGLVIIDEQHRFGVQQRAQLIKKASLPRGSSPHLLTMTATPIPRTIILTLYGDLSASLLDEMPKGRQIIKTWVVPDFKREAAYLWINKQINKTGCQAFIICPLIEESEHETLQTVKAVTSEFERLQKNVFPNLKLSLLHGRLKAKEKEKIMERFTKRQSDILVSTPVVEVGIDIPGAAIILIEDAQRFGLAQLHQLRGRVGRAGQVAYCLLFSQNANGKPLKRLKAMETINIGSKLAQLDLELRGPGEIYGLKQHGFVDLKVADLADLELIKITRQAADQIVKQITNFPLLKEKLKQYTIKSIEAN